MRIRHRLTALLFFLARNRHSAADLAAVLRVSLRTLYRDISRLRADGYEVQGVSGPGGGFWLSERSAPAAVHLDVVEVRDILLALHGAHSLETELCERLLGTLPRVHSTELRAVLAHAKVPAPPPNSTIQTRRASLKTYSEALARGRLFSFNDPARCWMQLHQRVWPMGLVLRAGVWNLVGVPIRPQKRGCQEVPLHRIEVPRIHTSRVPARLRESINWGDTRGPSH